MDTDDFRLELSYPSSGKSIAVLKTIIAIGLASDFDTRESKISFSELEEITGLSRPMISSAVTWLIDKKWIALESSSRGRTNNYKLLEINSGLSKSWTKLPYIPLTQYLRVISNRGPKSLTALKNYLLILRYRSNTEDVTRINHKTLVEKGNLRPNLVKAGNDLLINSGLIALGRCVSYDGFIKTDVNLYHVKGLYYGKRGNEQQSYVEDFHLPNMSKNLNTVKR